MSAQLPAPAPSPSHAGVLRQFAQRALLVAAVVALVLSSDRIPGRRADATLPPPPPLPLPVSDAPLVMRGSPLEAPTRAPKRRPRPAAPAAATPVEPATPTWNVAVCLVGVVRSFQVPWMRKNIAANVIDADPAARFTLFALLTLRDTPRRGTRAAPTPTRDNVQDWLRKLSDRVDVAAVNFTDDAPLPATAQCNASGNASASSREALGPAADMVRRFALVEACFTALVVPHEQARHRRFDFVVRLRPDVAYALPLPLFSSVKSGHVLVSANHHTTSDHLWIARRDVAPAAFSAVQYLCFGMKRRELRAFAQEASSHERAHAWHWGNQVLTLQPSGGVVFLLVRYWEGIECRRLQHVAGDVFATYPALRYFDCRAANATYAMALHTEHVRDADRNRVARSPWCRDHVKRRADAGQPTDEVCLQRT